MSRRPIAFTGAAIPRRAFLRQLAGAGALCVAASLPVGCGASSVPSPGFPLRYFSPYEYDIVQHVAARVLAAGDGFPAAGDLGVARGADALLATLDPSIQADFHHLLELFDAVPLLAGRLRPFLAQDAGGADSYLTAWEDSPLTPLRQGFVGLRRLCAAIYYTHASSWSAIRYAGPWIGRIDVGYGLDNQGDGPELNPNVYAKFTR